MDRKEFLRQAGMVGAAVGLGLISTGDIFENPFHSHYEQLRKSAKSISVYELESIIAARALLFGKEEQELANWKNHVVETSEAGRRINDVRRNLAEMSVFKAKQFLDKQPTGREVREVLTDFDLTYRIINEIKDSERLYFVEQRGKTLLLNSPLYATSKNSPVYKTLDETPLTDRFSIPDLKVWFSGPETDSLIATLSRMSPESLFIAKAAKDVKISLEEAVALAHIESRGREFALSNTALGMLQINFNPDVLKDNYRYATSRNNELAEYLKKHISRDSLLEDLSSNPRANVAFGINLAEYKRQKIDQYYVAAYNIGIEGVSDLPKSVKYKLRNPGKITERDLNHHSRYKFILRYQKNFLAARDSFKKLQGSSNPKA